MHKLFYYSPASSWEEGLPIGNGKMGAMIYGDPISTSLQCNEDSIWQGNFRDRNPIVDKETSKHIQDLIFQNKSVEAQRLIKQTLTGVPEYQRQYEPAGDIHLSFDQNPDISNYHRELDLSTALYKETYKIAGKQVKIESFASYPDNIIGWKITSSKPVTHDLTLCLNRLRGNFESFHNITTIPSHVIGISGQTSNNGVTYAQFMKVSSDGVSEVKGQYITVSNFTEVTLYTTIASTFRESNPTDYCIQKLKAVENTSWETLKKNHISDYQTLFNTLTINISDPSEVKDVPSLFEDINQGKKNNYLTELMFQYGRYLLISSSRPNSLPANLQGIWNKDLLPAWDSKFTININTEMNYWPAEKTGLSECHHPLFDHITRMYPNGLHTAKTMYDIEGFTAHHNTDIWADTAPQDDYMPATYWPMGALWLSLHIWQHYDYTKDQDFLDTHFYLLEEALRFILQYLIESPEGYLVTNPSVSPENSFYTEDGQLGYVSYGATMDNQLIWEVIQCYLKGTNVTHYDEKLAEEAAAAMLKLPPHRIGRNGQLMEWIHDYTEAEPGHRHFSHLFGMFPGHKLKYEKAEVINAAKRSLELRLEHGGGHTGWSAAWLINLWAHFKEKDQFHESILKQLKESTLPNLLDNHPPFQIDGNFGFTSGIIEGIIQYSDNRLDIFPALPDCWADGEVNGICLPNKVKITISWKNHSLDTLTVTGAFPYDPKVFIRNAYQGHLSELDI